MRAPLLGLLIAVAFLGGASSRALTAHTPATSEPATVTEYIYLPPSTITLVQERAEPLPAPTPELPQMLTLAVEPQRFYDAEALIELLGRTPWPVNLWPDVLALVACEAPAAEGADAAAVGDEYLMPLTGPSLGLTQINVAAWPQYARSYDLLDAHENLLAAWSIYVEVGRQFSPTWSCAS